MPSRESVFIARDEERTFQLVAGGRVSGRIFAPDSEGPVAQATVWLAKTDRVLRPFATATTSDEAGSFTLGQVEAGTFEVLAQKDGMVGTSLPFALAEGNTAAVNVHLEIGRLVRGRVLDAQGKAIESAELSIDGPKLGRRLRANSARDGSYVVGPVVPGGYYVYATAGCCGPSGRNVHVGRQDLDGVDLKLDDAINVEGVVLASDGSPSAGVEVFGRTVHPDGQVDHAKVVTAEEGRFKLASLRPGSLLVQAIDEARGAASFGPEIVGDLARRRIVLRLQATASLAGKVKFSDGAPAPAIRVIAVPRGSQLGGPRFAVSEADGTFHLRTLMAGTFLLLAEQPESPADERDKATTVKLGTGEQKTSIELVIAKRDRPIAGVVVAPNGVPASGVAVLVGVDRPGPSPWGPLRAVKAFTDTQGRFKLLVSSDGLHALKAESSEYLPTELHGIQPGTSDVVVRLEAGATISGTVVTADGNPVPRFELVHSIRTISSHLPAEALELASGRAWDANRTEVIASDGRFTVANVKPGAHEILALVPGGGAGNVAVSVAAGEQKSDVRIVIKRGRTLRGRIVDHETDAPVRSAFIRVDGLRSRSEGESDGNGVFAVDIGPSIAKVHLNVSDGRGRYVPDVWEIEAPESASTIDVGVLRFVTMSRVAAESRLSGEESIGLDVTVTGRDIVVRRVLKGSPAEMAGLASGDRILAIDGRAVLGVGPRSISLLLTPTLDRAMRLAVQGVHQSSPTVVLIPQPTISSK